MNYLAHLFLADSSVLENSKDECRIGSLLADFTVGTIVDLQKQYGKNIARSIKHHRAIDSFTDSHFAVINSTTAIGDRYGIYSGIVIDVVFDHFLLRHWNRFSNISKKIFYDSIYLSLAVMNYEFPQRYQLVIGGLVERRWLDMYFEIENVGLALSKIGERFSHKNPLDKNIQCILDNYKLIEDDFLKFFPELVIFSDKTHKKLGI